MEQCSEKSQNESDPTTAITDGLFIYRTESQSACWLPMIESSRKEGQQRALLCIAQGWCSTCHKIQISWILPPLHCYNISWSAWILSPPAQHPHLKPAYHITIFIKPCCPSQCLQDMAPLPRHQNSRARRVSMHKNSYTHTQTNTHTHTSSFLFQ